MRNKVSAKQSDLNDDFRQRYQAEIQRRFVELQFKRSELEKKLRKVDEVLFSLGREMEEYFVYDQFNK